MRYFIALCLFITVASCGSKNQYNQAELDEAYKIQKEILGYLPSIQEALKADDLVAKDSLTDVVHDLEENLFEIPGYHLELPGHEGHDHSHERVELTSTEMVDVNKALLEQIKEIKAHLGINE